MSAVCSSEQICTFSVIVFNVASFSQHVFDDFPLLVWVQMLAEFATVIKL